MTIKNVHDNTATQSDDGHFHSDAEQKNSFHEYMDIESSMPQSMFNSRSKISKPDVAVEQEYLPQHARVEQSHNTLDKRDLVSLTHYNYVTYILHMAGFFTFGISSVVALIMSYSKRQEAEYSWLSTHFDWQIKTFWYCMLLNVFAILPSFFGLGGIIGGIATADASLGFGSLLFFVLTVLVLFVSLVLFYYRLVRGVIALSVNKPIPMLYHYN